MLWGVTTKSLTRRSLTVQFVSNILASVFCQSPNCRRQFVVTWPSHSSSQPAAIRKMDDRALLLATDVVGMKWTPRSSFRMRSTRGTPLPLTAQGRLDPSISKQGVVSLRLAARVLATTACRQLNAAALKRRQFRRCGQATKRFSTAAAGAVRKRLRICRFVVER